MSNPQFGRWIEAKARELRERAEIGPFDRLDPFDLAEKMQVAIRSIACFEGIEGGLLGPNGEHQNCWDAATLVVPNGAILVIYNPAKDKRRMHATLMEELSHVHLGHKPSEFRKIEGIMLRTWHSSKETQAYSVGAAALLPAYVLKGARTRGHHSAKVAEDHQVSHELVVYRENVSGIRLPKVLECATR